jgi:hypothetical protein
VALQLFERTSQGVRVPGLPVGPVREGEAELGHGKQRQFRGRHEIR